MTVSGCGQRERAATFTPPRFDLAAPAGQQIEIDELIKPKWTLRQMPH